MDMDKKEALEKVAAQFGFTCLNKKSVIGTIIAKAVSLLIAILFMVLRSKAKAKGQTCRKVVFTVLAVLFFVGVITSGARIEGDDSGDIDACDCDDFEDDFR
jgi:cytochrome c oxidase assembly factor CtaG